MVQVQDLKKKRGKMKKLFKEEFDELHYPLLPSFKDFLLRCRLTHIFDGTPIGDFAIDAEMDKTFPKTDSWAEIKSYLQNIKHVNEKVEEAARITHVIWLLAFDGGRN